MKHVYAVLFHKNPEQLKRLLNALDDEGVYFVIHVCKNYKNFPELENELSPYKNLFFCPRVRSTWASYLLTKATFNTLNTAFEEVKDFDFFTVLSAQDYPIKNKAHIKKFLSKNLGKEFIVSELMNPVLNKDGLYFHPIKQHFTNRDVTFKYKQYYFKIFRNKYILIPGEKDPGQNVKARIHNIIKRLLSALIPERKFINGLTPYHGSNWLTLSHTCCAYILDYYKNDKKFNSFWKYVFIPEEIYFHTIIMNSPFKANVINDNLNLIKFEHGPHPVILNKGHFNELKQAPDSKLFARKFDMSEDEEIMDYLDNSVLRLEQSNLSIRSSHDYEMEPQNR